MYLIMIRTMHVDRLAGLLMTIVTLAWPYRIQSAAPITSELNVEARDHVIWANPDGMAVDVDTGKRYGGEDFRLHVNQLLRKAEEFSRTNRNNRDGTIRLMVHVHGGLNGFGDTRERLQLVPLIMQETNDWYYPVFIAWPSDFFGTYGERLVKIRQGHKINAWLGAFTAPFVFAYDVAHAVVTMPRHWFYQFQNGKDRVASAHEWLYPTLTRAWKVEDRMIELLGSSAPVYRGRYLFSKGEHFTRGALDFLQSPVRATVGTLIQSTLAEESWRVMNRRTSMPFFPADMFDAPKRRALDEQLNNIQAKSASAFFRILLERSSKLSENGRPYEITLVGHSMGTIVLNKLFTHHRAAFVGNEAVRNIVYMGAACSINDAAQALKPLLLSLNTDTNHPTLRFYNLTLNRVAEIAERSAYGFVPCGSLLDNIDQHLENPETPLDRTMGSEVNILSAIEVFKPVFFCSQFKAFDRVPGHVPSNHGDFHLCPFWRSSFWSKDYLWTAAKIRKRTTARNSYPRNWAEQERTGKRRYDW